MTTRHYNLMRTRFARFHFNLVELTVSMVLTAICATGVASLMPISQEANQHSVGNYAAADAGDQLLRILASKMKINWELSTALPITRPGESEAGLNFEPTDASGILHNVTGLRIFYNDIDQDGQFDIDADGGDVDGTGFFRIEQRTDTNVTDFAAVARVWRSPDYYTKFNAVTGERENVPVPASGGLLLNVELSFPADKPYVQREKRSYAVSVSRPLENPAQGYSFTGVTADYNINLPTHSEIYAAINVNPSNGNDNDFVAQFLNGQIVTRAMLAGVKKNQLDADGVYMDSYALTVWFRPSGNGDGNKLRVNGRPVELSNGSIYHVSGQSVRVRLQNGEDGGTSQGGGMGDWWLYIYAQDAVLTVINN